jgi:hypothetical protein
MTCREGPGVECFDGRSLARRVGVVLGWTENRSHQGLPSVTQ